MRSLRGIPASWTQARADVKRENRLNYGLTPMVVEPQLDAILNYCDRHTTTHVAVFFTVYSGTEGNLQRVRLKLLQKGLADHDLAILIYAKKGSK
jgi:hypothetical protein